MDDNHSKLLSLYISNFRNLDTLKIEFSEKINCIFGENGNGKTNILEAIHYISHKKSFRKKTAFPQILSIDSEKPEIIISALLKSKNSKSSYSMKMDKDHITMSLNGDMIKRKPFIQSVFINPFDSYKFHTSASFRLVSASSHSPYNGVKT